MESEYWISGVLYSVRIILYGGDGILISWRCGGLKDREGAVIGRKLSEAGGLNYLTWIEFTLSSFLRDYGGGWWKRGRGRS